MKRLAALGALVLMLSGCASGPTLDDAKAACLAYETSQPKLAEQVCATMLEDLGETEFIKLWTSE